MLCRMEFAELATRLVEAADDERRSALLLEHPHMAGVPLAYALKEICYEAWSSEPQRAVAAAGALRSLSRFTPDEEVAALAEWVAGIASLVDGRMERAISHLNDAEARFLRLKQPHTAASTQVSKLYALAVLGHYDEAVECGLRAREVFLASGDTRAAGRVEHNIGNIYFRRARYTEAERFQLAARARFLALGDEQQLVKIDNSLAVIHSQQYRFRSAEQLYVEALRRAERAGLVVTQAEIESGIGTFALFQGRYDRALDFLERARRKFSELGMPHESAVSELEIADTYLELNLWPEAAAIYERVTPTFANLEMRAEQAQALAHHGRASILLGQMEEAYTLLEEARRLYAAEGNRVGEAMVTLTEAQLHYAAGDYERAEHSAREAAAPLAEAGAVGRLLLARWLCGDSARAQGRNDDARALLEATLEAAETHEQPQIAWRCYTSLGVLAVAAGDTEAAERSLKRAVELIETLRAPLPAEEFRTAFFTDKLVAYDELVRLCLKENGRGARVVEALGFAERARSRALADLLGGALRTHTESRDPFDARLVARLEELREELNWFYSRINRPDEARGADEMAALHEAVRAREAETLELTRQLQHHSPEMFPEAELLDVSLLQRDLGADCVLVEYTAVGDELAAFVVTNEQVEVVRGLGSEREATAALEQFRFQINTLRFGAGRMRQHMAHLTERARKHLAALYELLLAPVAAALGERRLVVVPHRALHYVPFHALYDGDSYVVERREVTYAPSAVVLRHCLARPQTPFERALLLGVADEQTPRVRDEVEEIAPLFPQPTMLLDDEATIEALRERAPLADILHVACHGQFRPNNPLFSSLHLADGWLTVREAAGLDLVRCGLVTLSACETGVSHVAPGDELLGLVRAFLAAGAPSLVLSLWTVDDDTTARLMASFYKALRGGARPAAALRHAQVELLAEAQHPYFWSPFVLVGRW
jgi:CHAT domain-containing protein